MSPTETTATSTRVVHRQAGTPIQIRGHAHRGGERRDFSSRPTVSAIIPTLNEARNLPQVLGRLPGGVNELVIVDGHSDDDTVQTAQALRPDARIIMQGGKGKGNALACGFAAARGDIIVMLDADGSTDPAEIPSFVGQLARGGADFVKGSRYLRGGGSSDITRLRSIGNRAIGMSVNALFGTHYTDLCYGFNAFWRRCLPYLHVTCSGFEVETIINIRAAKAHLNVVEVPSYEHSRISGLSNLSAWRDGTRVLKAIISERLSSEPVVTGGWIPPFTEVADTVTVTQRAVI